VAATPRRDAVATMCPFNVPCVLQTPHAYSTEGELEAEAARQQRIRPIMHLCGIRRVLSQVFIYDLSDNRGNHRLVLCAHYVYTT
jgi:hypothetical protein